MDYLRSLSKLYDTSPDNFDKFNFINHKEDLNIQGSLKNIARCELFRNKVHEVSPANSPTLNPFLLGCLIPLGIYSR